MRYLVGFVFVPALGTLRLVGCGDEAECGRDDDCDDRSVCTVDRCLNDGVCSSFPIVRSRSKTDFVPCELGGGA
jgi:hypothetical protein